MAGNLQSGFTNNINTIAIRAFGNKNQIVTDRAIDIDGDGTVESVTITTTERAGNKVKNVVTKPDGVARTVVDETFETDGGINTSGDEFTEGVG